MTSGKAKASHWTLNFPGWEVPHPVSSQHSGLGHKRLREHTSAACLVATQRSYGSGVHRPCPLLFALFFFFFFFFSFLFLLFFFFFFFFFFFKLLLQLHCRGWDDPHPACWMPGINLPSSLKTPWSRRLLWNVWHPGRALDAIAALSPLKL